MKLNVVLLVFASCAAQSEVMKVNTTAPIEVKTTSAGLASLGRSGCLTKCAVFSATIYDDGHVEWVGRRFVKEEGTRTLLASAERAKAVELLFHKFEFQKFSAKYLVQQVSDMEFVTISYRGKSIRHAAQDESVSAQLIELESELESAMGIGNFIRNEM